MATVSFLVRVLLAIGLCLSTAAFAAPLRVVLERNYPPFAFRNADGKLEGYSVDLWRLWEQQTGIKVELHPVDWPDVQRLLREGRVDVADTIFHTEGRTAYLDFSAPYADVTTSIYAHRAITGIHDFASLKGFAVTVQVDDACVERLQRRRVDVRTMSYQALLAGLADRSVKLLCMDDNAANYDFFRLGVHDEYMKTVEVAQTQVRRAVRKGDAATLALVEGGMARISPDDIAALHDKWMGRPLGFASYGRPLLQALAVLGGLVLLLGAWLVSVRKAVRTRTGELEYEKAQLRTLIESSTDLIWLKDAAGIYQACNRQLTALLDRPKEEIIGKDDVALFGAQAGERFRRDDIAALLAGRALTAEDHVALPGQAGERVFETIKTPIRNADGTVLGVLGVARDITERRERERLLFEQDRLLQEMSALARIGAWELDPADGQLRWTDEVARICQAVTARPLTLELFLGCCKVSDRKVAEQACAAAIARGEPFDLELEFETSGPRTWVRMLCSPVLDGDRVVKLRGTVQDVTERRALEESMRMANLIYQTSPEAIVVTDADNRIVDVNPAFTAQTGMSLASARGTRPGLFESAMHDSGFYAHLWQHLVADGQWQGEVLDRDANGTETTMCVDIRMIRQPDGGIFRHVIQFHDISAQKQKDELIWRQTNFDALTGLPNRRLFLDRLEQDIRKAHGAGEALAVLQLDFDRFRDINDSFGAAQGDRALIELTGRIAGCLPDDATMGRLGGDAFALVIHEVEGQLHPEPLAQAVIEAVAAPLHLDPDGVAYASASVGISVYPENGSDAIQLVRHAEHAVRLSKEAGRGQFQYFMPELHERAHVNFLLTNDLREALARHELAVHYQPIVEVATGNIRKAETLLRWRHPERGMVSPALFIPLAEEAGLIREISEWVVEEAIASVLRWNRMYGRVIELSVNISASQFEQRGPLSWLDRVVQANLPHHSITVEITEGVLVHDAEQVNRCLGTLHAAGAKVSIDDFGTGFSALSYLKRFEIDYLKIDKSFIDNLPGDSGDKALTEAIVDLAHRLGIEAIAEGVETGAQRDALAAIGCDYIQGYFYSKAVTREVFERLLEGQVAH
ncbi:EAL domain-containing protein [Pseudoduganella sp. SL102]|uniref:EAL domain-containing protein n=1 Tax=Pseudoduganella sp. SL102 TaxID=2995154 RepID=UPI00248C140C|nr:EAL domain-containing protein [Pseudoduganella sp. SL102]WBS05162.1 EAL domain-containing protein [Pseudoduganella sp. SL102]